MSDTEKRYTLADLHNIFPNESDRVRLGWGFSATHAERLHWISVGLDYLSQEMTRTRQYRQDRKEDELTTDLISGLRTMGIQATHDTAYGGHCDVVIEGKANFLWLGEAKIHGAYDWLYSGFEQLGTRYSTGLQGQDAGGVIIFCYNVGPVNAVMTNWEAHLRQKRPEIAFTKCPLNDLAFISVHKHEVTGRDYQVRHIPIALGFKPRA